MRVVPRRALTAAAFAACVQAVSIVALALVFGALRLFYGFFDASDTSLYHEYATWLSQGKLPYLDWQIEYPPLAVPLFTLPGHLQSLSSYRFWFALVMGIATVLTAAVVGIACLMSRPQDCTYRKAVLVYALSTLAIGALVMNRYDAVVALVMVLALLALASGRRPLAAFALGVGFALKIVPVILLPLVLILSDDVRQALRSAAAFAVSAAAPFAVVIAAGGHRGVSYALQFHLGRPLEIESVLATPLLFAQLNGWILAGVETSSKSQQLIAPGAEAAAWSAGPLSVLALAAVYWLVWRRRDLLRTVPRILPLPFLGVLAAFISTGKVLSPQYLVWTMPFVAIVAVYRPRLAAGFVGVFVLTHVLFPANYWYFAALWPKPVMLVIARNLLLLTVSLATVRELWTLPEHPPARSQAAVLA